MFRFRWHREEPRGRVEKARLTVSTEIEFYRRRRGSLPRRVALFILSVWVSSFLRLPWPLQPGRVEEGEVILAVICP